MKKILTIFLTLAVMLTAAACGARGGHGEFPGAVFRR